ncbi:MAG: hypothetical protein ACJ8AG_18080 [Ktedonobacteraceae bacterium]|jgi:hypothetical protein
MNIEKLERLAAEKVLSLSPDVASVEVIHTTPIKLPGQTTGDAFFGTIVIGAGELMPGTATVQGVLSLYREYS